MSKGKQRKYPPMPASQIENRLRTHKGMTFVPVYRGKKRSINTILTKKNKRIDGRLADKRYYRIYKHKGQRFTLYVGPEKHSHGGLRHKPKKKGSTKTRKLKEEKIKTTHQKEREDENKVDLDKFQKITFGPHEGKYFNKETGDILTENQIRVLIAQKGVKKQ